MNKMQTWANAKRQLGLYKKTEADLRREICGDLLIDVEFEKGIARRKTTYLGYEVKAEQKLSYAIDFDVLKQIWEDLSEEDRECLKKTVTLDLTKYKKLPENSLFHDAIVSKSAMPTLTGTPAHEET